MKYAWNDEPTAGQKLIWFLAILAALAFSLWAHVQYFRFMTWWVSE